MHSAYSENRENSVHRPRLNSLRITRPYRHQSVIDFDIVLTRSFLRWSFAIPGYADADRNARQAVTNIPPASNYPEIHLFFDKNLEEHRRTSLKGAIKIQKAPFSIRDAYMDMGNRAPKVGALGDAVATKRCAEKVGIRESNKAFCNIDSHHPSPLLQKMAGPLNLTALSLALEQEGTEFSKMPLI